MNVRNNFSTQKHRRNGLTLTEAVVVLLMAGILVSLLLPWLVRARANTRVDRCAMRLGSVILKIQNFETSFGAYPSGCINPTGPIKSEANGLHQSWIAQLLPLLDTEFSSSEHDIDTSTYDEKHTKMRNLPIALISCPASPMYGSTPSPTSFGACHHDAEAPIDENDSGVFFLNSRLAKKDISDGLEFTLFLGEIRNNVDELNLGWMSGTRATLRNTGSPLNQQTPPPSEEQIDNYYVGGFGSWHSGLANMAMGGGEVRQMSNSIDPNVYRQIGNRQDGAKVQESAESANTKPKEQR